MNSEMRDGEDERKEKTKKNQYIGMDKTSDGFMITEPGFGFIEGVPPRLVAYEIVVVPLDEIYITLVEQKGTNETRTGSLKNELIEKVRCAFIDEGVATNSAYQTGRDTC